MKDVWDAKLINKINSFMDRKAREYPELRLTDTWQPPRVRRATP